MQDLLRRLPEELARQKKAVEATAAHLLRTKDTLLAAVSGIYVFQKAFTVFVAHVVPIHL